MDNTESREHHVLICCLLYSFYLSRVFHQMVQIRSASGLAAMGQKTSLIDLGHAPEFIDNDVINTRTVSEALIFNALL